MPVSAVQAAKRPPIKVSLALALQYEMAIKVSRDSSDKDVVSACRQALINEGAQVHPDKGRQTQDQQKLQAAKEQ